jgi:2-oxoglutarate dehydrogenase E1 component
VATDPIDDLNSGFVQELLADYLASPESVAPQWRALFEARPELVLERLPNGARLRELSRDGAGGNGAAAAAPAPAPAEAPAPVDDLLLGGVAAAMSLVKAHRTHGHLAAHIDPLGSSPPSDPALDPDRLEPRLTPELQAQIPAKFLRLYVPADNLAEALPKLRETYCGTLAFELEHISSHEQRL